MKIMTTRSLEDIHAYYQQALDLINEDHPHFEEIKRLLIDQVNDELHDHDSNNVSNRRASRTGA